MANEVAVQEKEIITAMDELEFELAQLLERLVELERALRYVLRKREGDLPPLPSPVAVTPLAETLQARNLNVQEARAIVDDLLHRLEV
jgi:hypothetical protein